MNCFPSLPQAYLDDHSAVVLKEGLVPCVNPSLDRNQTSSLCIKCHQLGLLAYESVCSSVASDKVICHQIANINPVLLRSMDEIIVSLNVLYSNVLKKAFIETAGT